MSAAMHSAAALAFLGDAIDLDAFETMVGVHRLVLATTQGPGGFAHLNGDPDALVAELVRLARIGAAVGVEARLSPDRGALNLVSDVERRFRRR